MKPKISIITVCYNSVAHIEEAILSVINQPYENKEYIIIDGGSTDGTLDIIDKYKDKIDYFISEPDKGISDAFNKGIKAATGELIGILNSDDFMMSDVLSKVADQYEQDIDIYRGYCIVWDEEYGTKRELHPNLNFGVPPFGAKICHESAFITRRLYDKVGTYKVSFRNCMDLDLFIRIYKDKSVKTKFLDICIDTFRKGGVSSIPVIKREEESKRLIRENGGNVFDVFIYIMYLRIRYYVKIVVNRIRAWRKK